MSDIHRIQFIIPTESYAYGKQGYKLLPTTSAVPSQMNKPKINAINTTLNMSLFFTLVLLNFLLSKHMNI